MLIAVCSAKGSPGATSAALALAAAWPRPVVLVEADGSGGDLAYRCQTSAGGPVSASPNLLTLAAGIRGSSHGQGVVAEHAQQLACGVDLVQGVTAPGQSRGLIGLWSPLAQVFVSTDVDVIADLGRFDRTSPTVPVAEAADVLVWVASTSLESVMHLREGVTEALGTLNAHKAATLVPLLVGEEAHAGRDCADLDTLLAAAGVPVQPAEHLAYDPKALQRLERGEPASGRLGRTLLIRGSRALAANLLATTSAGVPA